MTSRQSKTLTLLIMHYNSPCIWNTQTIIATGTLFFFYFDHLKEKSDFNYSNKYLQ